MTGREGFGGKDQEEIMHESLAEERAKHLNPFGEQPEELALQAAEDEIRREQEAREIVEATQLWNEQCTAEEIRLLGVLDDFSVNNYGWSLRQERTIHDRNADPRKTQGTHRIEYEPTTPQPTVFVPSLIVRSHKDLNMPGKDTLIDYYSHAVSRRPNGDTGPTMNIHIWLNTENPIVPKPESGSISLDDCGSYTTGGHSLELQVNASGEITSATIMTRENGSTSYYANRSFENISLVGESNQVNVQKVIDMLRDRFNITWEVGQKVNLKESINQAIKPLAEDEKYRDPQIVFES